MASVLFGGVGASLYSAFFDCDCDCSAGRRRSGGKILVDYFACDALHDSILPLAAGMNATTAALPSFVVVAVSSWWGGIVAQWIEVARWPLCGLLVVCVEDFVTFLSTFLGCTGSSMCGLI